MALRSIPHFVLAAGILLASQSAASAACVANYRFHVTSEGPWNAYGAIGQGKSCTGSYKAGGTTVFKRLWLVSAPARGKIQLHEGGTYTYTAPKGYTGPDSFTLRVCGKERNTEGCANIVYSMTVS
ncbi:hypothetical protein JQ596_04825 [Bradyrhizobium manausense]|uniref:Ig-like domain-containing protein n=1 Tax=Bradyrhizobium TaxID=374 RepID=UPI001BAB59F6|nr:MULTISPECIES: Ig-like domain-containing protein [Bradyrhizobium]MBR0824851.1 hypothetical protein [Bradyrhizobium manausense]UVO29373.1 hypothetical protein KUF59_00950 [Bradyrhizobium arachidis]